MINSNDLINKVNDFFNREYSRGAAEISIFKNDDGSYDLFNTFIITSEKGKYNVTKKTSFLLKEFASLKHAVTWCIFEQRNKITETKRIEDLDRLIYSADAAIELHRYLISKTKDTNNKLIYYAKLSDEEAKRKKFIQEIADLIRESKGWQTKRFNKKDQKY